MEKIAEFEFKAKSIFYGMELTNGIRRELVSVLLIIYFLTLGHKLVAVTTMFAASKIIMTFFEFPTGAFADHYSRKMSIMISFFLMSAAFFGIFIFENFWLLALCFILQDIAWTFQSGTTTAWIIDALDIGDKHNKLATLFSRFFFFEKTGAIIGGAIGFLIISIRFRLVWLAIALTNFIMLIIILRYMEERNFRPSRLDRHFISKTYIQAKDSLLHLFNRNNKQIRGLALAVFFLTLAVDSFFIESPLILFQKLNLSPAVIAGISSVIAVVVLVAPFIGEKLSHRFGARKPLFFIVFGISIFISVFALTNNVYLAVFFLMLFSLLETALITIHDSAVQHSIPSRLRATLGSAMNIIWAMANALAAFLVGISIAGLGLVTTTIISGAVAFLTAIIYLVSLEY